MMIKITACFLALGLLAACESTTNMAKRETLRDTTARYASNQNLPSNPNEPPPPAEGPEDVHGNLDPNQNPALVPTPLLRTNAIGNP
jgi:hypothetical protein